MRTALDTNVFSLMWANGDASMQAESMLLQARREGSLIICPVVYVELRANPVMGSAIDLFLKEAAIEVDFSMTPDMWREAGDRFSRYCERRRQSGGGEAKGLVADFLVGAHALMGSERLLTFDVKRFEVDFPELNLMR